jgi:hypothetical protein
LPAETARPDEAGPFLRAVVAALLPIDEPGSRQADVDDAVQRVAGFVQGQVDALPGRLRLMFAVGMAGFRTVTALRHGRGFLSMPQARRRAWVEAWAYGPVAPARQLFRGLRSTALLAWYEQPHVRAALAAADDEDLVKLAGTRRVTAANECAREDAKIREVNT